MKKRSVRFGKKTPSKGNQNTLSLNWDENILSSDDESNQGDQLHREASDSEEDITLEQKRKKIAREYLSSMKTKDDDDSSVTDGESAVDQRVSTKLAHARLKRQGRYYSEVSEKIGSYVNDNDSLKMTTLSCHKLAVTCCALSCDDSTTYSGSKDNSIISWDCETGSRSVVKPKWSRSSHMTSQCHEGEVLSIAISSDKKYLASGGRDSLVRIFDTRCNEEVQKFTGHRGPVTSLAFQKDSYSLFSGSLDRCVKHWDLNEMGYLQTLFGHQDAVNCLDCWTKERPISASSDRTVRMWKVSDDTHLVFRGHKANIDNVQYLTAESFISSGQDGSLCVWKETQKKPVVQRECAHGFDTSGARWISSLSSSHMTDLVASGSYDGYLRLWSVNADQKRLEETAAIPMDGFVNSIALSAKLIVVGLGNEHRLGRWWKLGSVKNCLKIIKIPDSVIGVEDELNGDAAREEETDETESSDNE